MAPKKNRDGSLRKKPGPKPGTKRTQNGSKTVSERYRERTAQAEPDPQAFATALRIIFSQRPPIIVKLIAVTAMSSISSEDFA